MKISIKMALIAALLASSTATTAWATPGISIDSAKLPLQSRTDLRASIDKAKASDASSFRDVHDLVAGAREANAHARGRKAPIANRLAALGPKALLPMLELVAFAAPPLADGETARERASLERDLVEAIGLLRDARALPVLLAVLARESDFDTTRTATEAVARLDSSDAATALVATLNKSSGERATAVLAGMGACHRSVIARTLADRMTAHPDEATARKIAKSLGRVGNVWAWKTLADRTEEAASREIAARSLMSIYVQYAGDAREEAAKSLLVIDDPHTSALVQSARQGASPELALALDDLARRLAESPIH